MVYNPPKTDMTTKQQQLIQRDDDRESVVRDRLSVYHEQTEPLIRFYSSWAKADPSGAPTVNRVQGGSS